MYQTIFFRHNNQCKGFVIVEQRLVLGREARYQSNKDYCRVGRLGSGRREDPYMSCKAVWQPNCCHVVDRDV